ncbi:hypothetical protein ABZ413_27955, partial [Nocardia rhamnosiphila]|uniref:hypothetical protein n=1 Tax=Nocardia rhamnosiphila TaxID=426716 RepID=UPI0033FF723F
MDLTREVTIRSQLRDLERRRWTLAQRLEERPESRGLMRRLERAEQDHSALTAALNRLNAHREAEGRPPWVPNHSDRDIAELRVAQNRVHDGRRGLEELQARRNELRAQRDELRRQQQREWNDTTPVGTGDRSDVTAQPRWDVLESRYSDQEARVLPDLSGARNNAHWMAEELTREQQRVAREIQDLERDVTREQDRLDTARERAHGRAEAEEQARVEREAREQARLEEERQRRLDEEAREQARLERERLAREAEEQARRDREAEEQARRDGEADRQSRRAGRDEPLVMHEPGLPDRNRAGADPD